MILVTSLSDTEEVISGLIAGADRILTKPYNESHLLTCIENLLAVGEKEMKRAEPEIVQFDYGGRQRVVRTEPEKVIDLLLNIYQGAIYQNEKLLFIREELRRLNEHLETIVNKRTAALEKEIDLNREIAARLREDIAEREKVERALSESKEKLNLALENGDIGTFEWNLRTNKILCGDHFLKMLGLKSSPVIISPDEFENLIREEDRHAVMKAFKECTKNGNPCESRFRGNPVRGKVRQFSLKALVGRDENGKPLRITGVCFDITKLQEDNDQIVELNNKLLLSNRELERFAYVASHDLQEPLRMVSSFTQLLERQYGNKLDNRAREYISFAVDGARRMYNLINGLLAYSRIQRKNYTFTKVDINKVIETVKRLLEIQIMECGAEIVTGTMPVLYADESQMIQLFQNLISNALKFNMLPPRILITSSSKKDNYIFSIKDNGIGIGPEYFDKIFGIFQKLHTNEEYEGTGIGLSICKSIVEKHGGTIRVESQPGSGSTFYFTIPRPEKHPAGAEQP